VDGASIEGKGEFLAGDWRKPGDESGVVYVIAHIQNIKAPAFCSGALDVALVLSRKSRLRLV